MIVPLPPDPDTQGRNWLAPITIILAIALLVRAWLF